MDNTNGELVVALASALRSVEPAVKSGRHQQGYAYAKPGDVLRAVRGPLLNENLVLLLQDVEVVSERWEEKTRVDAHGSVTPAGWRHVATIKAHWALVHPSGELHLATLGAGVDETGQGGAISKATTDAHKDALSLLGHLVFEDDAKGGGQQGGQRQDRQQGRQEQRREPRPAPTKSAPAAPPVAPAAQPEPSPAPAVSLEDARGLFGTMAWGPLGRELLGMEKQVADGGRVAVPFARAALERLAELLPAAVQAKDAEGKDKLLRWAGGLAHNEGLGDTVSRDALTLAIGKSNGLAGGAAS